MEAENEQEAARKFALLHYGPGGKCGRVRKEGHYFLVAIGVQVRPGRAVIGHRILFRPTQSTFVDAVPYWIIWNKVHDTLRVFCGTIKEAQAKCGEAGVVLSGPHDRFTAVAEYNRLMEV